MKPTNKITSISDRALAAVGREFDNNLTVIGKGIDAMNAALDAHAARMGEVKAERLVEAYDSLFEAYSYAFGLLWEAAGESPALDAVLRETDAEDLGDPELALQELMALRAEVQEKEPR